MGLAATVVAGVDDSAVMVGLVVGILFVVGGLRWVLWWFCGWWWWWWQQWCVWRWWKRVIIELKKKIQKNTQKEEKTKNKEEEDSEYILNGKYLARHVFRGVLFVKCIIIIYFHCIGPIYIIISWLKLG